jgi:AcrR family transcriptional regulator
VHRRIQTRENDEMTRPGLRERKKQRTRETIQREALRLIAEQGYDATTVDQIAAAAEVSPSTFFRYFPTKEDAILQDEYDPLLVAFIDARPADEGAVAAVRHGAVAAIRSLGDEALPAVLARTKLILGTPALRNRMLEQQLGSHEVIAQTLARRSGRSTDDLAVRTAAAAITGALIAALLAWVESDDPAQFPILLDKALDHLERGLPL